MCDYSLQSIRSRLAVDGEQLIVHRFPTNSIGLASAADLRVQEARVAEPPMRDPHRPLWSAFRNWMSGFLQTREPVPAVCVPPGARLVLRDIPERLQRPLGVAAEEEVTFTQIEPRTSPYRDAVRFGNGKEILLQKLEPGQRVDVLGLSSLEAAPHWLERMPVSLE